jgi:ligand-binding sensor domain-containing protein
MLFCVTASGAGAQDRNAVSTSRHGGIVKLPVVDKQDIRFLPFSVNEAPRSRVLKFTQDGQGFLWLATTTGLYRYDGTASLYRTSLAIRPA